MTTPLRLVIFDVDGTLVDSQGDIVAAMTAAFDAVGLALPARETLLSIVGLSLDVAMPALAPDADDVVHRQLVQAYKDSYMTLRAETGAAPDRDRQEPERRGADDEHRPVLDVHDRLHAGEGPGGERGMSIIDAPDISVEEVPRLLLRKPEAAAALGIGIRTLDHLVSDGEIKPIKIYSTVCFDPRDLRSWIDKQKDTHQKSTESPTR